MQQQPKMKEIQSPDEIPAFRSEDEEAEFWSTHSLGSGMLERMGPLPADVLPPADSRRRSAALRLDSDIVRRLKALARQKHKNYQTLLKEFVVERLYEEEKREGLVGQK